jgi:hypothetical protein
MHSTDTKINLPIIIERASWRCSVAATTIDRCRNNGGNRTLTTIARTT